MNCQAQMPLLSLLFKYIANTLTHTHTHTQPETKGMSPKTDREREKKGKETLNTNAEQNWAERNRNWIKIQKKRQEMKQKNATKFVHDFCVTVTFFCLFVCSFQAFV